jgi:hypothetical protein
MKMAAAPTRNADATIAVRHPRLAAMGGRTIPATSPPSGTADCFTEKTSPRRAGEVTRASTWLAPGVANP